ncbi:hypothetical protein QAD02_010600 [Eretmocerus hayati]|uniref:Uncharacterized protein n=2 Tax=Eretmocerus hayati TaxID=131215 RepID=A0ACC2N524_9HYME|nr:hypothetical protein QAD02_007896 [Eretmocerus hayati]KAJ8674814.1 hypothetical protein QAD02_010600 [Eretmocerus hayati]
MAKEEGEMQTNNGQNSAEHSVMSNLTSDELQVIRDICSLPGLDDTLDPLCSVQSDRLSVGPISELNVAEAGNIQDANAILAEFDQYRASDTMSVESHGAVGITADGYVETSDLATRENLRIQDIREDLMNYEQLNDPTQYTETMRELELTQSNPVRPASLESNQRMDFEESDTYTYRLGACNTIDPAIHSNESMPTSAMSEPQSDHMDVSGDINELRTVYSVEIKAATPAIESPNVHETDESIFAPNLTGDNRKEEQANKRCTNKPAWSLETPPTCSNPPKPVTCGAIEAQSDTNHTDNVGEFSNVRSSNRKRRHANASISREDMMRTRYFDFEELRKQAESGKPNLNHPFWQNLRAFVCARSVFWKKERRGIICPFSYIEEKHRSLGYKTSSKHVLIRNHKNPQMPVCTICHESRYHVQDAEKCGYCIKAYFDLIIESGQGEMREIMDRWY